MNSANYSIRSVQRVCDILDLLQSSSGGLRLLDFAEASDLPKSSVFRYLATLESRGYVERDARGYYTIGLSLSGERLEALTRRLMPSLLRLREELGETINIGLLDGSRIAYLQVLESPHSIRNAPRADGREFVHSTALGKVLCAGKPREVVLAVLQHEGMPAQTPHTITDVDEYLHELERTRRRGYALDDEENELGGRCIAMLVPGTKLPVAVSLSAPTSRFPRDQVERIVRRMRACIGSVASFVDDAPPEPTAAGQPTPRSHTTYSP